MALGRGDGGDWNLSDPAWGGRGQNRPPDGVTVVLGQAESDRSWTPCGRSMGSRPYSRKFSARLPLDGEQGNRRIRRARSIGRRERTWAIWSSFQSAGRRATGGGPAAAASAR